MSLMCVSVIVQKERKRSVRPRPAAMRETHQNKRLVPTSGDDGDVVGPVVLDDAPVEEDAEAQLVLHHSNPLLKVHRGVQVARDVPAAGVRHHDGNHLCSTAHAATGSYSVIATPVAFYI